MPIDARSFPLDPVSTAELAAAGLEYAVVPHEGSAFETFHAAVDRGFLAPRATAEQIAFAQEYLATRRKTGVYDRAGLAPDVPVGTVDSWVTELTTSPGRTLPMWAISAVTVAPTHRRRGIARAMLTGELRAARDAGLALAGLTVSEATIYGRWGFSPAVYTTDWKIDARRARFTGPRPAGRLDFLAQDEIPARLGAIYERIRTQRPGRVEGWDVLWRRAAALRPGADDATKVRGVVYRDADGVETGVLVFTLAMKGDDYSRHELAIHALYTDGDDAAAALWRFALEHDLVATVTATLRGTDEPLRWMIADQRAAEVTTVDHHWLRVLDVPAALSSRSYAASDALVLAVRDDLGFAEGTWRFETDAEGAGRAETSGAAPDAVLGAGALASILLGGVSAATLASAGAITAEPAVLARLDAVFRAATPPILDIWY